jgi:hypothetical protein
MVDAKNDWSDQTFTKTRTGSCCMTVNLNMLHQLSEEFCKTGLLKSTSTPHHSPHVALSDNILLSPKEKMKRKEKPFQMIQNTQRNVSKHLKESSLEEFQKTFNE